jgi:Rrf2 family protein
MRVSAKGRYAFAALIEIAGLAATAHPVSVVYIAEKLDISKLFLEQTIAMLKKSGILQSTKGKNGGYRLARDPRGITAYDVLSAVETSFFEATEAAENGAATAVEATLRGLVWEKIDAAVDSVLKNVTLSDLLEKVRAQNDAQSFMPNF